MDQRGGFLIKRSECAGADVRRIKPEKPILVSDLDVVYVGTFVPKTCGIATFTNDLSTSIAQEMGDKPYRVVAITDRAGGYDYPPEVTFEIRKNVILSLIHI